MSGLSNLSINASLKSTGKSNGTPYTDTERTTGKHIMLGLLIAAGHVEPDHAEAANISEEAIVAISETIEETEGQNLGIPNLARRAYTKIQNAHLDDNGQPTDPEAFPKKRDYTSIGLILKKAVKDLKVVGDDQVNTMFPTYGKAKAS